MEHIQAGYSMIRRRVYVCLKEIMNFFVKRGYEIIHQMIKDHNLDLGLIQSQLSCASCLLK
jgi:hypothetical protein